ncbi:MAG: hypothetical protein R3A80_07000, partial [Bdellovibrionota bacterium]
MLVGSYIIAAGLSIVSLLVSDKFSFYYTSAKFLGIAASLVLISFFVLEKKLNFTLPTSKKIKACLVVLLVSTITPLFMQNPGEPVTGLSLILLWALLA